MPNPIRRSRAEARAAARPDPKKLLPPMISAAKAAGKVLMSHFNRPLKITEKAGAGLVTEADIRAEAAAVRVLKRSRFDFDFLMEEAAPELRAANKSGRWVIDPLDGTTNFVHRFPMFCVSIGAEWEGEVVAGVIWHPVLKDLYTGTLGGGAFVNGKRMHVSPTKKIRDSLLTTGFTYRKNKWLHREMEAFERLSEVARAIRRPGSAALDLAYVARGVFDGFWERRLSPWDIAAGMLLVREAGGKVTDFSGQDSQLLVPEILASNSWLHGDLLASIQPELCDLPRGV